MKWLLCSLALLCGVFTSRASAQFSVSANAGYVYVKAAALQSVNPPAMKGIGGFRSFYSDIGYTVRQSTEILVGFGGFKTTSTFIEQGISGSIEVTNWTVPVHTRVFLTKEANKPRAFFDIGPSINVLEASASVAGFSLSEQNEKFGALVGIGFLVPLKGAGLLVQARYSYVPKQGDIDASTVQATAGIRFGGG